LKLGAALAERANERQGVTYNERQGVTYNERRRVIYTSLNFRPV